VDDHSNRVIARVLSRLDEFANGGVSLPDLQHELEAAAGALDNTRAVESEALMVASNDLEVIAFTMPIAEQGPEATRCLDALRVHLSDS
jgi:hypothetical protein